MRSSCRRLFFAFAIPSVLTAQSVAERLVDDAYTQVRAGRLDSAETLLRPVLDSSARPQPDERASALMVHGLVEFFQGRSSDAAAAFHEALQIRIDLNGDWLFKVDSSLGRLWRRERCRVICGPGGHMDVGFPASDTAGFVGEGSSVLTEKPRILSGPHISYPEYLREAQVQGRVVVALVIDTAGRAEPGSIKILQSPHPDFSREAQSYVNRVRFRPGRIGDQAVRVCTELPIDFKIRY